MYNHFTMQNNMKKKILSLLAIASMAFAAPCTVLADGDPVPLEVSDINPTSPHGGPHKTPIGIPSASLDDHTLYFNTPCDGDTLRLLDEDGVVVYSVIIPEHCTDVELPFTLSGEYELQIIRGNYCFWGMIEL